jgi:hypothetical protein
MQEQILENVQRWTAKSLLHSSLWSWSCPVSVDCSWLDRDSQ